MVLESEVNVNHLIFSRMKPEGLSRTELYKMFSNHISKENLNDIIKKLVVSGAMYEERIQGAGRDIIILKLNDKYSE